jgi:hypothetical protein
MTAGKNHHHKRGTDCQRRKRTRPMADDGAPNGQHQEKGSDEFSDVLIHHRPPLGSRLSRLRPWVVCGFAAGGGQSTGAPNDVVSFLSILSSIGASVGELALNGASAIFGCGCTGPFSLAVSEALCYLVASRVGEQLECQSLSKEYSLRCISIKTVLLAGYLGACSKY